MLPPHLAEQLIRHMNAAQIGECFYFTVASKSSIVMIFKS